MYAWSTLSRGRQPARVRTRGAISATGRVVTGGAGSGAVASPSWPGAARPAEALPDVYTGPDCMRRSAEVGLPPRERAQLPRVSSAFTMLRLESYSKRTAHMVQSSTTRLRTSAITWLETIGPRDHCFCTQVWWMETLVVSSYLRNSERVLPARKQYCTVTSCAP